MSGTVTAMRAVERIEAEEQGGDADPTVNFTDEVGKELAADAKPDRSKMIMELVSLTAKMLKSWIETMRKYEAECEAEKAAAHKAYDEAVAIAAADRDLRVEKADSDLRQLRETMKELEPARSALAEKAK